MESTLHTKSKHNILNVETRIYILDRLYKGNDGPCLAKYHTVGKDVKTNSLCNVKTSTEDTLTCMSTLNFNDGLKEKNTLKSGKVYSSRKYCLFMVHSET